MEWIPFVFGLCIGSFINVVVYRLNHRQSPLKGRSVCPKCKHRLAWYDNIPLLSFVLLKGRCRSCRSPISWQYPLVELTTGVLTVLVFQLPNCELRVASYELLIIYFLFAIFVSDLRYMTIPDQIVFPAIFISAVYSLLVAHDWQFILSAASAASFFYFLTFITHGRGMGMGDVKLSGLIGLILGWPKTIVALFLACLAGAAIGTMLVLLKKKDLSGTIPFGPFLTAATLISMIWGEAIWQWGWR